MAEDSDETDRSQTFHLKMIELDPELFGPTKKEHTGWGVRNNVESH